MPSKPVTFLDKTYKTQKLFEAFVKNVIYNDIGICYDIKNTHPTNYIILIKILERHPGFSSKAESMCNIKIIPDSLNRRALKTIIIKKDGEIDISWRCAISGRHKPSKGELTSAMRSSIEEQILQFKNTNKKKGVDYVMRLTNYR